MRPSSFAWFVVSLALLASCSSDADTNTSCVDDSECPEGQTCGAGVCGEPDPDAGPDAGSEAGADAFYKGAIAADIVKTVRGVAPA